jgi:hypothetical protein
MFSWAVGGNPAANAVGIVGVLGGVGHFASRLVLGLEEMTQRAYDAILDRRQEEQNRALDELERRLRDDQDRRTETCLRDLRRLYEMFRESCSREKVVARHHQVVNQVEEVFNASVQQLKRSLELYEISRELSPETRSDVLAERERVIQEVIETRAHLSSVIEEFQTFATKRQQADLSRLRDELDETLSVAKKTEERLAEIDRRDKVYEESEFE